jgi:hypothetical protein
MDARTLDVTTGITSLAVFIVMLVALPRFFNEFNLPGGIGIAYVLAIAVYIALMSGAGFLIREKIA